MLAHSTLSIQERYTINAMFLASTRDCITAVPNQTTAIEGIFYPEAAASQSYLTVTAHRRTNELAVRPVIPDEALFQHLVYRWHAERGATSSITQMAMCWSYQRIIGMGRAVVIPLILRDFASKPDNPDHWFWALQAFTGEDPVPEADRGDMQRMAAAWLDWGYRNGYAW
jgi:hypothetical protein